MNVFGILGKDVSVKTEGMINGIFEIGAQFFGTMLHIIDSKFAGPADGYLGYDFLCLYKVTIDMNKMCLRMHLDDLTCNEDQKNTVEPTQINKILDCAEHELNLNEIFAEETARVTDDHSKIHEVKNNNKIFAEKTARVTDDQNKIQEVTDDLEIQDNNNTENYKYKSHEKYKNKVTDDQDKIHEYDKVTDDQNIQATDGYKIQEVTDDLKVHEKTKVRVTKERNWVTDDQDKIHVNETATDDRDKIHVFRVTDDLEIHDFDKNSENNNNNQYAIKKCRNKKNKSTKQRDCTREAMSLGNKNILCNQNSLPDQERKELQKSNLNLEACKERDKASHDYEVQAYSVNIYL